MQLYVTLNIYLYLIAFLGRSTAEFIENYMTLKIALSASSTAMMAAGLDIIIEVSNIVIREKVNSWSLRKNVGSYCRKYMADR